MCLCLLLKSKKKKNHSFYSLGPLVRLQAFQVPFYEVCNNKQPVLWFPSSPSYLYTLAKEQRVKGKYKSKCQESEHYPDLITTFGIFLV